MGRRMVARLGERRAARQQEEQEVRQLWEQRRARMSGRPASDDEDDNVASEGEKEQGVVEDAISEMEEDPYTPPDEATPQQTSMGIHWAVDEAKHPARLETPPSTSADEMLGVPDRPISHGTMRSMRSGEEAFEYDTHLRRSMSGRTARTAVSTEVDSATASRHMDSDPQEEEYGDLDSLPLPRPAFATPIRHAPSESTATEGTMSGSQSSTNSTRDPLSMMFIMGSSAPVPGMDKAVRNFPSEVGDTSGSDWGTPARELDRESLADVRTGCTYSHADLSLADSPSVRGPQVNGVKPKVLVPSAQASPDKTPPSSSASPSISQRNSTMSWIEVGGPEDKVVPSDAKYHKKSGSISAKFGRNLRTVIRRRSQTSKPGMNGAHDGASPTALAIAVQNANRRGSDTSMSPSQSSATRSTAHASPNPFHPDFVRHQPSVSSMSPSLESSANSMLLQHQLAGEPSPVAWLPRADLNDPRIHSSKLSPFPGISQLERRTADGEYDAPPRIQHQLSDSAVPSQQRVTSDESIYSMPLQLASPTDSRRGSADSAGKRSWLAKAFGSHSSPHSSISIPRHDSLNDSTIVVSPRKTSSGSIEGDPFAAPTMAPVMPPKPTPRQRPASPTVSVVHEDSEEGSRLTRMTPDPYRLESSTPIVEEEQGEEEEILDTDRRSKDISKIMDHLLSLGPDHPSRPDILNDPPRKLLLRGQVLQVVNAHVSFASSKLNGN